MMGLLFEGSDIDSESGLEHDRHMDSNIDEQYEYKLRK